MSELLTKKIQVEIGPRISPSIQELRSDLADERRINLFVERDGEWAQIARNEIDYRGISGYVVQADGGKMPLANQSAELVFAQNLFGSQGLYTRHATRYSNERVNIGENLPAEISRVLKKEGKVVIIESATPAEKGPLNSNFERSGLKLVEDNVGGECFAVLRDFEDQDRSYLRKIDVGKDVYSLVFEKQ